MTSERDGESEPVSTKHCRACYNEMPKAANKCVKCGSIQDATRFLSFSSTILSLLVALVSVATFAIPILRAQLYAPHPVPHVAIIEGDDNNGIIGTFSNGGDAPMSIGIVQFVVSAPPWWRESRLRVPLFPESGLAVVKPNDIVPARLDVMTDTDPEILKALSETASATSDTLNCAFQVVVVDAAGNATVVHANPSKTYCKYAASVLSANWRQRTTSTAGAPQAAHP